MRQQYHLKRIDGVLYAWDINKLVKLADSLQVIEIPLTDIKELDEPYWFSNIPTCRDLLLHLQLCNEGDLSYPIMLFSSGKVMDGMHRVLKALSIGKTSIRAVGFGEDPLPDYIGVEEKDLPY